MTSIKLLLSSTPCLSSGALGTLRLGARDRRHGDHSIPALTLGRAPPSSPSSPPPHSLPSMTMPPVLPSLPLLFTSPPNHHSTPPTAANNSCEPPQLHPTPPRLLPTPLPPTNRRTSKRRVRDGSQTPMRLCFGEIQPLNRVSIHVHWKLEIG